MKASPRDGELQCRTNAPSRGKGALVVRSALMQNLSIKARIRLAITVLGAGYLTLLLLLQWTGAQTRRHIQVASASLFPATLSSQQATAEFQKLNKRYSDAVLTEDSDAITQADEAAQALLNNLQAVQQYTAFDPARQKQVSELINRVAELNSRAKSIYTTIIASKGNLTPQLQALAATLARDNQSMDVSLQELRNALSQDFQAQLDNVSRWSQIQKIFGLLLFLVVTSCAVAITVMVEKRVSLPLAEMTTRFNDIAGDLTGAAGKGKAADEIAGLVRSFSAVVSHLQEMAALSESMAGGDLSQPALPRSQHDALGRALGKMADGLGELVRAIRDNASQVAAASVQVADASEASAKVGLQASAAIDEVTSTMHEMSMNVQNIVKTMQTQTASVNETSASIDQMVASIQRVADTSKVLLDISDRSRQEVQSGIASMDKAGEGLNRINTSIHASAEIIDSLGSRAANIDKIIEVIDDLSEQTNLLALNAAIEAARAGEHGLGFAVVADEVRKLAERSAQSTKEISELVGNIQKEARQAVHHMDQSTDMVNEGLTLGSEVSAALRKISAVVGEVYKFAQEIGAATNEQSHGSSQIARSTARLSEITSEINSSVEEQSTGSQAVVKAMEGMRELVQQSSSSSSELAASAEQMSHMSRSLLDIMGRFKLAEDVQEKRRAAAAGK